MSADIINLRRARKNKARADKERIAAENRSKFGRPKAEMDKVAELDALEQRRLDGHRLSDATTDGSEPS